MICNTCGEKVREDAVYCPNCGFKPTDKKHEVIKVEDSEETKDKKTVYKPPVDGSIAFLWGLIGYFIPIIGLILFIVWKENRPKDSKAAGIGALIRVILITIAAIVFVSIALLNQ